jgi:thymidylate synthase (FAD)
VATHLKVTLMSYTPDPERVAAAAARQCYSKFSATKAFDEFTKEDIKKQLGIILENGHFSVLEHSSFTFAIEGISRACSHQLVRHRIASYSQQSQRFVKLKEIEFIVPEKIAADENASKMFREALERCRDVYNDLVSMGVPAEDARYILPNASPTKIVVTMNARSLINFFELRCCLSAQWEIRQLADEMLRLVKGVAPTIFERAGPFCVSKKICPEKKYDCPKWVELFKKK